MTETTEVADTIDPAPEWAIVEIMGHLRLAGRIMEEDRFGAKLLRVDRPYQVSDEETVWVTSYHAGTAIYQLRLCTEETARKTAQALGDPRPRQPSAAPAYLAYAPDEQEEFGYDD